MTHYYTDDEGVDHPIRTGTGGTLRDDDRIMAVIEAARAAKNDIAFAIRALSGNRNLQLLFQTLLDLDEALDSEEE